MSVDLFCLPHAGGSSALFRQWAADPPAGVRIGLVDYPGHGTRRADPLVRDLSTLVRDVVSACQPREGHAFALFGHSMGAVVAHEAVRELARQGRRQPVRLFVSASGYPRAQDRGRSMAGWSDAAVVAELRRIGGTPEVLLREPEILRDVIDTMRCDSEILAQAPSDPPGAVSVPITVLGGLDDPVVATAALSSWCVATSAEVTQQVFPGGHFFVTEDQHGVLAAVVDQLRHDELRAPRSLADSDRGGHR